MLLAPTVIYVKDVLRIHDEVGMKAASHITGEGHPGNIPRVLPDGLTARIDKGSWERPAIFQWLQEAGGISGERLWRGMSGVAPVVR